MFLWQPVLLLAMVNVSDQKLARDGAANVSDDANVSDSDGLPQGRQIIVNETIAPRQILFYDVSSTKDEISLTLLIFPAGHLFFN